MIAYTAAPITQPQWTARRSPATRESFIQDYLRSQTSGVAARATPTGLTLGGRPYVALPCRCIAADCPGWAVVHDDPHAVSHFERLFGAEAGT